MALITDFYREQNTQLHEQKVGYGNGDPPQHIRDMVEKHLSVVDYGCGKGRLPDLYDHVTGYDPAIKRFSILPAPADLVICKDVMEHVEPECVDEVLEHIKWLHHKTAYFVICCRPASKTLSDGRNAHISLHPVQWWLDKLKERFRVVSYSIENAELSATCE